MRYHSDDNHFWKANFKSFSRYSCAFSNDVTHKIVSMYSTNDYLYPSVSSRKLPFKNMSFFVCLVYLILLFNYQWSFEICSFNISWWSMLAADLYKWCQMICIRTHWIKFYNLGFSTLVSIYVLCTGRNDKVQWVFR